MRYIFILLISSVLFSCNLNQPKGAGSGAVAKGDSTIDLGKLSQMTITSADQYRKVLDHVDQGDLNSLEIAGKLLINCSADTLTIDSMFVAYNDFYNSVAGSYLENNESVNTQLEKSPTDEVVTQLKTQLAAYGIQLRLSEGTYYLEPQTEYLLNKFGSKLSPAYREYLAIGSKEQQTRFAEDGKILIPSDSLSARITTWENFMTKYPDFISIKMAQDQYAQYLGAYLAGMDNSRVFNPATNHLDDSSRVSFEAFILKNPESNSASVVKAHLDLLKTSGYNYSDRVDSFLLEKVYH